MASLGLIKFIEAINHQTMGTPYICVNHIEWK